MGGAAAWQFGTHLSDRWFACNPGAGFAETARFLRLSPEDPGPDALVREGAVPPLRQHRLRGQPAPVPDRGLQRRARRPEAGRRRDGRGAPGRGGPPDPHHRPRHQARVPPRGRVEVDRRLDSIATAGRKRIFHSVDFVTYTLKYNKMSWVTIDALGEHWARASVRARLVGDSNVEVVTQNVNALTLDMPPGWCPLDPAQTPLLSIDSVEIPVPRPRSDRSWHVELVKKGGIWDRRPATVGGFAPARACPPPCRPRPRPRTWRSASGTTSRGRSTTPSWTRSSSSSRPARRNRPGGRLGRGRKPPGRRPLAESVPGRCPGQGRQGPDRRRHRRGQPRPLGRPRQQRRPQADRRPAADPLGRRPGRRRRAVVPGRDARADPDLSQPAQPVAVRRAQQRLHLSASTTTGTTPARSPSCPTGRSST